MLVEVGNLQSCWRQLWACKLHQFFIICVDGRNRYEFSDITHSSCKLNHESTPEFAESKICSKLLTSLRNKTKPTSVLRKTIILSLLIFPDFPHLKKKMFSPKDRESVFLVKQFASLCVSFCIPIRTFRFEEIHLIIVEPQTGKKHNCLWLIEQQIDFYSNLFFIFLTV